jgi:hypothetical protein
MQTLVQIICSKGESLRDSIVNDARLREFNFKTRQKRKPGRPRGWAKIGSTESDRYGALNIEWDSNSRILSCRVVNRGSGRPAQVLGDFVAYIFERHRKRIRAVSIIPR